MGSATVFLNHPSSYLRISNFIKFLKLLIIAPIEAWSLEKYVLFLCLLLGNLYPRKETVFAYRFWLQNNRNKQLARNRPKKRTTAFTICLCNNQNNQIAKNVLQRTCAQRQRTTTMSSKRKRRQVHKAELIKIERRYCQSDLSDRAERLNGRVLADDGGQETCVCDTLLVTVSHAYT